MFEGITIFLILAGLCMIGYSLVYEKKTIIQKVNDYHEKSFHDYEIYSMRIEELNTKILEVNEFSEFITAELEKKHQELLFLYQLIGEKSKEIKAPPKEIIKEEQTEIIILDKEQPSDTTPSLPQNKISKNKMILQLSDQGYDAKDIAQMLNVGIGEVKLVLHLYE